MRIEPSGIVMIGECEIQTPFCTALQPAPITAVWGSLGRRQINVCRQCLEEMIRLGEWESPGAHISRVYDIAVYNNNQLQLVVEVKKRPYEVATDLEDWATRIHRNLLVHSGIPSSAFFLFAISSSPFYLWTRAQATGVEAPPQYTIDSHALLSSYQNTRLLQKNEEKHYEDMIYAWLSDVVQIQHVPQNEASEGWLFQSGLFAAVQGGQVAREARIAPLRELQAA